MNQQKFHALLCGPCHLGVFKASWNRVMRPPQMPSQAVSEEARFSETTLRYNPF